MKYVFRNILKMNKYPIRFNSLGKTIIFLERNLEFLGNE